MNCPVCKMSMTEEDFGGVKVDVCAGGCKGIWFDWSELARLDKNDEGLGKSLEEALHSPRVNDANRGVINCPKCNVPMHRHLYKSDKEVNVDECYACGGMFLDSGELSHLRDHHMTEQEEGAYVDKLLANIPSYQQALKDLEKEESRAQALTNFAGFFRLPLWLR